MDEAAKEFTEKVLRNTLKSEKFLKGFLNMFLAINDISLNGGTYDMKGKGLSYKGNINSIIKSGAELLGEPLEKSDVELNRRVTEISRELASEEPATVQAKLLSDDDVSRFRAELEKSAGKLPTVFYASNRDYRIFYNDQTGIVQGNPEENMWVLNEKSLYDLLDPETGEVYLKDVDLQTGYQSIPENQLNERNEILKDGGRDFNPGPVIIPFVSTTAPTSTQSQKTEPSKVKVISPDYGVVQVETNPTKADTQEVINLIAPQIEKQAYKENVGVNANWQFSFGNMWSRVNLKAKPLLINSFAGVNKVKAQIEELKKTGKVVDKSKYIYDYHELDQDGNSLPPISDLQPLINKIQNALGIDMSGYDSVLGNIYLDKQSIAPHRDTTEAKSAEGYPVIVYTIGNDSGLGIWDDNKGKITFQGAYKEDYQGRKPTNEILTKDGTIYTFGMNGKGRFALSHTTPLGNIKKNPFPAIKLSDGRTLTNYTITLTFRRAADLEPGMPKTPAKLGTQPQAPTKAIQTIDQIYASLPSKTQSENVILPKDLDENKTYTGKNFWDKIVPEARNLYNNKIDRKTGKTKSLLIAYRGNKNKTFLQNYKDGNTVGNPFDFADEKGTRDEQGITSTKKFLEWMITGNNFGNTKATEDYRQAIINDIKSGKIVKSPILYYEEKGYATHATALDYLINKHDWSKPQASTTDKFSKKNIFTVTPIQAADKKAVIKASIATQFIGFGEGIAGSSTETYRQQAGALANTSKYSTDDMIFVSIGGKRGTETQQKTQQDRTIKEAIKAVEAGATILTDNKAYTDASSYNTGEKRLYKNMEAKGYNYSEITVDGQVIGTWSKTQPQAGAGNFEQLYNAEERTTILAALREKYKDAYKDLSDVELVQRINNRLMTQDRDITIEILNKCFKK